MTNEEYVRRIGVLYNEVLSLRKDEDYVINQPQMERFIALCEFFIDFAKKDECSIEPIVLSPREEHGGLTATFVLFDVYGEGVARFCDVMRACSAISVDTTLDHEVRISCTVPNVFVHK